LSSISKTQTITRFHRQLFQQLEHYLPPTNHLIKVSHWPRKRHILHLTLPQQPQKLPHVELLGILLGIG
jgi:hypothetical protein